MGELGGGAGEQVVLGRAAGVAAGLEVDDAGGAGEERRHAGIRQLEQHDAAERLGVLDDQVAGQRRRAGAGRERHGHEAACQSVLGGHEVGLEVRAVVRERVHGALHEAQDGALAQLVRAAGDGGRHLDEVARGLVADGGHRLEVLAGVGEHGLGVVQRLGRRGHVLAGDHGAPVVADVGQRVDEAGAGRRVSLGARPLLGRVVVPDEHAGAVVAQVAVLAVDEHVAGGVAAGEHVAVGHLRDGLHDDRARELGDLRRAVHLTAVLLEDVEGALAREADADGLEDVEGGLVDALELAGVQHVPPETGGDGVDPGSHCGNLAGVRRRQVRVESAAGGQSRCCSERSPSAVAEGLETAGAVDGADADAGCVGHGPESITGLARGKPSHASW